jgi:pimeloyl-ACP methyl ester carboxylesterase
MSTLNRIAQPSWLRRVAFALTFGVALATSAAHAAPVTLKAADGTTLAAQTEGKGELGVLLLHGEGRDISDYKELAPALARAGTLVLGVNLRGHGTSGGAADDAGWAAAPGDVEAGVAWLKSNGATRVAIVGADATSVLALTVGAALPEVDTLVLISPRLGAHGLKVTDALGKLGERAVLLIAGEADTSGTRATSALEGRITGRRASITVPGEGPAVPDMFKAMPALNGEIVGFVSYQAGGPAAARTIQAGDASEIKTEGKKFGED